MDEVLKFLQQFNAGAGIVTGMMSPSGAVGLLLQGIKAIRDRRKAAGENVEDLDQLIDNFEASLAKLVQANAAYYNIPEKVVSDPDVS